MKKKILVMLMLFAVAYLFLPSRQAAAEETKEGWYLTGYNLRSGSQTVSGEFADGSTYTNKMMVYDAEDKECVFASTASELLSKTENEVLVSLKRTSGTGDYLCGYSHRIEWYSPAGYLQPNAVMAFGNIARTTTETKIWSPSNCKLVFRMYNSDQGEDYNFLAQTGSKDIEPNGVSNLISEKPIPASHNGAKAYLILLLEGESTGDNYNNHLRAVYEYTYKIPAQIIPVKTYTSLSTAVTNPGWYKSSYVFTPPEAVSTGKYMAGDTWKEVKSFRDVNGTLATSSLENLIYYQKSTLNGATDAYQKGEETRFEWTSPADYFAANEVFKITGISNTALVPASLSMDSFLVTYKKDTTTENLCDTVSSDSYIKSCSSSTVALKKGLPAGTKDGETFTVTINYSYGLGVYTYMWRQGTSVTEATAAPTSSAVTKTKYLKTVTKKLYLSGRKKKRTYKFACKKKGYSTSYKSSNKKRAVVSKKGIVKARKKGKVTITATMKKGKSSIIKRLIITIK